MFFVNIARFSSFRFISLKQKELAVLCELHVFSCHYVLAFVCLFLLVAWVVLKYVVVAYLDYIHLI